MELSRHNKTSKVTKILIMALSLLGIGIIAFGAYKLCTDKKDGSSGLGSTGTRQSGDSTVLEHTGETITGEDSSINGDQEDEYESSSQETEFEEVEEVQAVQAVEEPTKAKETNLVQNDEESTPKKISFTVPSAEEKNETNSKDTEMSANENYKHVKGATIDELEAMLKQEEIQIPERSLSENDIDNPKSRWYTKAITKTIRGAKWLWSRPQKVDELSNRKNLKRRILNTRMITGGVEEMLIKKTNKNKEKDTTKDKTNLLVQIRDTILDINEKYVDYSNKLEDLTDEETLMTGAAGEDVLDLSKISEEEKEEIQFIRDAIANYCSEHKDDLSSHSLDAAPQEESADKTKYKESMSINVWMSLMSKGYNLITWLGYNCKEKTLKNYLQQLEGARDRLMSSENGPNSLEKKDFLEAVKVYKGLFDVISHSGYLGKDSKREALCENIQKLGAGYESLFAKHPATQNPITYIALLEMVSNFVRLSIEDVESQNRLFAHIKKSSEGLYTIKKGIDALKKEEEANSELTSEEKEDVISLYNEEYLRLYLTEMKHINSKIFKEINKVMCFIADFEHYTEYTTALIKCEENGWVVRNLRSANDSMHAYNLDTAHTVDDNLAKIRVALTVYNETFEKYIDLLNLIQQKKVYGPMINDIGGEEEEEEGGDGMQGQDASEESTEDTSENQEEEN
ncbi:hypothetical protein NECID01_0031 [Nematocida sp. AWRm77]|nr:hypothetical protein NECID01_0031 [Nematocida sp. AWRm77]